MELRLREIFDSCAEMSTSAGTFSSGETGSTPSNTPAIKIHRFIDLLSSSAATKEALS
jgi:hypothetical protein